MKDGNSQTPLGTTHTFIFEWFEELRKMNKCSEKDEKSPFGYVRTILMKALAEDPVMAN